MGVAAPVNTGAAVGAVKPPVPVGTKVVRLKDGTNTPVTILLEVTGLLTCGTLEGSVDVIAMLLDVAGLLIEKGGARPLVRMLLEATSSLVEEGGMYGRVTVTVLIEQNDSVLISASDATGCVVAVLVERWAAALVVTWAAALVTMCEAALVAI